MTVLQPGRERDDKFLYLNRDSEWPGFFRYGLQLRSDGALQLQTLPLLNEQVSDELNSTSEPPAGPAGITTDAAGNVYFTDPANARVLKIDACDGTVAVVPCIGTRGTSPGQFDRPRGLLVPTHRNSLFVCDSGNGRVQVFDLETNQLVEVLGPRLTRDDADNEGIPTSFESPWSITGDSDGNVYVVDYDNKCVQKLDRVGRRTASFVANMLGSELLRRPSSVAASHNDSLQVYVLDEELRTVFVFDENGQAIFDADGNPIYFGSKELKSPLALTAQGNSVYVGDNQLRRVLKFDNYEFVGEAINYRGYVAALGFDNEGNLLVHDGVSPRPFRLSVDQGYRRSGLLWSGPLRINTVDVKWHRLRVTNDPVSSGSRVRLFVHTSNDEQTGPKVDSESVNPFSDSKWIPLEATPDPFADVSDLFIPGSPSKFLWVGALFRSDGLGTPVVSQMRVDFDHRGYLEYLPAIYRNESDPNGFLPRLLALFETFFGELEQDIGELARLFDPAAAPVEFLHWLAGWLALHLDDNWPEATKRQIIAQAFEAYGRRGTAAGLREALRLFANVNVIIDEPILDASSWCLPTKGSSCRCSGAPRPQMQSWEATENAVLGVTTMLAASQPQGAVLGTSATLDYSTLITEEEFGGPLFTDVAHQFSVLIYQSQLQCPKALPRVRAVIEREKPAHTTYHLCVVKPEMRVGFQARVGIDAVVGGPGQASALGLGMIGRDALIGGPSLGSLGQSRIAMTTRVG